jgi:hypothetical protein
MEAEIDKEGQVATLRVLTGHPFLVPAALDAAKRYRYKPAMAALCTPVIALVMIDIEFKTEIDPVVPIPVQ